MKWEIDFTEKILQQSLYEKAKKKQLSLSMESYQTPVD